MTIKPFLFIALFCAALYMNSAGGEFIWDDQSFVTDNVNIRSMEDPLRFFLDNKTGATREMAKDVYRPLTALSYAIDFFLWGLNSFGYHLTNIILHSANSILVFLLLFLLCGEFFTAFFGSLLFASHPIQTEVVCWVSGRSSALFLFFYLLSFIFYIKFSKEGRRGFFILSLIFFAFSLFSKEMSVTLPLILILYDLHFQLKEKLKTKALRYIPYFALVLFYVSLRVILVKKIGQFEGWGSPYTIFLTMSNVVVDYIRVLLFPLKLCAVGYPVPIINSIKEPQAIISLLLLLTIAASLPFLYRRFKIASFSIIFFFITLLPVLNIIPIKALKADRFLYLPSIGFCLLSSYIIAAIGRKFDRLSVKKISLISAIAVFFITAYSIRTILRTEDWKSEIAISKETVRVSPQSAWALTALGANFIERDNYAEAVKPLEKAVAISGGYEMARNALGMCYLKLNKYEAAVAQFKVAVEINPHAMSSRNMLGVAYVNLKRYEEAEKQFNIVLKEDPKFLSAYLNLGRLYQIRGDYKKALKQYFKMLQNTEEIPSEAVAYIRIGDVYFEMDSRDKAKSAYLKAQKTAKGSAMLEKIIQDKLKKLLNGAEEES